ncbi:unnamed protein product [Trichogramma brassicae]|uniref:Bromo domain-containing protein n=1 Tax=Trichogramma brassicae TaxID=86971 RepID=A0A6H5JAP4_9HYME|nr:unnamed protein product [Trichogramma brassicae]
MFCRCELRQAAYNATLHKRQLHSYDSVKGLRTQERADELYFLIAKFLSDGPCSEVANVLKRQLEQAKLLPSRIDWLGNHHEQTFEELETKYPHIGTQHLLQLCQRMGPVLEKDVPPIIKGATSMLGAGKQSMLRTKEDMLHSFRNISTYSARFGGKPVLCPSDFSQALNIVKVLQGRENSGPISRREAIPTSIYSKIQKYRHTLGHLSAVYCVLYDRTGKYVITGADDLLVKVWSAVDGRLLATFRGASSEIMDIAVNFDNTLLAAGSLDRILRIWCFQTMSPVAVLSGHSGMITSVNFCPIKCNGDNYLVTTSSDGSIAFWPHHKEGNDRVMFQSKPIQYHEKIRPGQAQMICASFSAGGSFLAAGSADHHVRVYRMITNEGPKRVLEVEAHSDTVDSIQWAHSGLKFISGSKDGTANIWHFEQQTWHNQMLFMTTKLPGGTEPDEDTSKKLKVTMVCWDRSDEYVVTAVSDSTLKIWDSKSGNLIRVLRGHLDEIFVLESHPIDPRIILSSGHDGQLFVWDVLINKPVANFQNVIDGQGNGAIFDAKWSPDGTMLAATDSHGHLIMYGFGSMAEKQKLVPKELFFHTDYRPLIRDANNYVLDEQTQTAPHLMPPPFLVDVDGNPYPPAIQRLVPGRENCHGEQLVPNVGVGANGLSADVNGAVPILPEELEETLYQPHAEEWPLGDREASCRRILRGLDQVMTLSAAEPFNAPVDLSLYPAYAFEVEYPIDLSTIRARFENRFYRRITSAQFDVRYIASNAEKFNERHSQIVKQARIITDICLRIIKDVNDVDVTAVYHGISSNYHSSSTESDVDVEDTNNLPSTSGQVSTRRMVTRRSKKSLFDSKNWKENCKILLRMLWQSPDSQPFKEPVDEIDHPTYSHIIETPMDLNQIQEDLRGDNYETLNDFVKDVRLVISNSRRFNINQRSKIYAMTVRLSAMFEEHLKTIMNMYNSEQRRKKKTKTRSNNARKKSTPAKQLSNGAGPTRKPIVSSDDEDVEDDEMQVNEVDDFSAPGPSCSTRNNTLRSRTRRAERKIMSSDDDDVEVEKEEKNDSQSSNVSTSEQSDDSKPCRQTRSRKKKQDLNNYDDDHSSDEDFEPTLRGKQTRNIPIKNCRKTRPNRTATNGRKYLHNDDEDDDLDDADVKEPQKQQVKRNGIKDKDDDNEDSEDSEDDDNEDSDDDDDEEESQDSVKTKLKINPRPRRTPQKRSILESSEDDDDHIGNVVEYNMTGTVEHDVYTNNESQTGFDQKNEQEESDDHNHDNINGTAEQHSDTDYDEEDDSMENHQSFSNYIASQSVKLLTQKTYRTSDAGSIGSRKSSRQRTGTKRARYKEETSDENDDDDDDDDDEDDYDRINGSLRKTIKKRKRTNKSYCEDEFSDEENQQRSTLGVSVSSRGRIRKMTPKAMQAFR